MQPNETRRLIGARVRALRRERHLTQEQLAELVDRTTDTISNLETGRLSTRIDTAVKLAAALGVTLSDLFNIGDGRARDTEHDVAVAKLVQLVEPLDGRSRRQAYRDRRTGSRLPLSALGNIPRRYRVSRSARIASSR